jgi:hypothetical protein
VGRRPAMELVHSLRVTLQKLEENFASTDDQTRIAELKRILLLRIADLEFVGAAVELADAEKAKQENDASAVPDEDDSDAAWGRLISL